MQAVQPYSYTLPEVKERRIVLLGAGNVAKSILAVSALKSLSLSFRVLCRSDRAAELTRAFLIDLPPIDVQVEVAPEVPNLSGEIVVLALGARAAARSRRTTKEALYESNKRLVETLIPSIRDSVVIVLTNPCTRITQLLVQNGIGAFGIGVANDQKRFTASTHQSQDDVYLVGAHNFYDLVFGLDHRRNASDCLFGRDDYRRIVNSQDHVLARRLFSWPPWQYDFRKLAATNEGFPSEYRWYARQRIHSKFHQAAFSGATAALDAVMVLVGKPIGGRSVTLESRLFFQEFDGDSVVGWPFAADSREPMLLMFSGAAFAKLGTVCRSYGIDVAGGEGCPGEAPDVLYLSTPFGDSIAIHGNPGRIHRFFDGNMKHLMAIGRSRRPTEQPIGSIFIESDRSFFDAWLANVGGDMGWEVLPQHRGGNLAEHSNVEALRAGRTRAVKLPVGDTVALVDDERKELRIHSSDDSALDHELRRIVRDEIGLPLFVARGCRIVHGGLVCVGKHNILVLAQAGGGKTTFVLTMLCDLSNVRYGSSERTVVWVEDGSLKALGVPESITASAGTLASFAEFQDLVRGVDEAAHWRREAEVRVQQADIISRTGSCAVQGISKVDVVVEVTRSESRFGEHGPVQRIHDSWDRRMLYSHSDLTNCDDVRPHWLRWIGAGDGHPTFDDLVGITDSISYYRISWSSVESIRGAIRELLGDLMTDQSRGPSRRRPAPPG
jgi:hypothetical protein